MSMVCALLLEADENDLSRAWNYLEGSLDKYFISYYMFILHKIEYLTPTQWDHFLSVSHF